MSSLITDKPASDLTQHPKQLLPDVFGLKDQWFLITGGSSGLGLETANLLAQFGANLILVARSQEKLAAAKAQLETYGGQCQAITWDLSTIETLPELVKQLEPEKLQGVFLNAAMPSDSNVAKFLKADSLQAMMQTNYQSPIMFTSALLKQRKVAQGGSILFMSSVGAYAGTPGLTSYAGSKSALIGSSKVLARELAPQRIRVNVLAPGMIETPFSTGISGFLSKEIFENDKKRYPLGYGQPIDAAKSALYLLSNQSGWLTGHTLVLDGGLTGV
jgi:NAD(P)-dependent dehydrogenase (short-subunit alcohol dehydrogenase family)